MLPDPPLHLDQTRAPFRLSTDPALLDIDELHAHLATMYWCRSIPRDIVARSVANSMNFAIYDTSSGSTRTLAAFARLITDRATFAYLCDVFVTEPYRARGLSKWLMQAMLAHPQLQGLRRWCLLTRDAHGLYEQFGFSYLEILRQYMEIRHAAIYERSSATT